MSKLNIYKRLHLFGITKSRVTTFIGLTITAAFFEGFGITMFLPVLEFIEKGRDVSLLGQSGGMWPKKEIWCRKR